MFEALLTVTIVSTVGVVGGKLAAFVVDALSDGERSSIKFGRRVRLNRARRQREVGVE